MPYKNPDNRRAYAREYKRHQRAGDCQPPCQTQLPTEFRLKTAADVLWLVEQQVDAVQSDADSGALEKARCIGYLAGIALKAIEADKVRMWACVAGTSAYMYHVGEEAWNTFCDEIGVTSTDLLDGAPGQWIIDLCDLNMADVAPTKDELKKQIQDWNGQFDHSGEVVDVEFLTEQWRRLYRELLGSWPSS